MQGLAATNKKRVCLFGLVAGWDVGPWDGWSEPLVDWCLVAEALVPELLSYLNTLLFRKAAP